MIAIFVVVGIAVVLGVIFLVYEFRNAPTRNDWDEPSRLDHMDGIRHPDQRDLDG